MQDISLAISMVIWFLYFSGFIHGKSLQILQNRLDDMLYVGLTENHRESATMFANVVGAQVISQHLASGSSTDVASNDDSGSGLHKF